MRRVKQAIVVEGKHDVVRVKSAVEAVVVTTDGFRIFKNKEQMALLRKVILLIPLIFLLPNFFGDKAFAVFLAEPVADILAAAVTTGLFFRFFIRMLKNNRREML